MEGVEAGEGGGAEAGYGGTDAIEGLAAHVAALGVEFVGVADQLFKQCLGKIIGGRERQVLGLDVLTGDSATDGRPGPIVTKLYKKLQAIQYGEEPDIHGWITVVDVDD